MAHEITAPLFGHFIASPGQKITLSDLTADSAAQTLAFPARWFMAMIYIKAFTAGTGTVGPIFQLKCGSDVGITADVAYVGMAQGSRLDEQAIFLIGFAPKIALKYFLVDITLSGTDAMTYDAVVVGI